MPTGETTYPTMAALARRIGVTRQTVSHRMKRMLGNPGLPLLPAWRAGTKGRFWKEVQVGEWERMFGNGFVKNWGNENRSRSRRKEK